MGGRVDIKDGKCDYKNKLTPGNTSLTDAGVELKPAIKANAKFMVLTSMIYLVILVPAMMTDKQGGHKDEAKANLAVEAKFEHVYALAGAILCLLMFLVYLVLQYKDAQKAESPAQANIERRASSIAGNIADYGLGYFMEEYKNTVTKGGGLNKSLLENTPLPGYMTSPLRTLFSKYAGQDGVIDQGEFEDVLRDLHLEPSSSWIQTKFKEADQDQSQYIDFNEFLGCFKMLAVDDTWRVKDDGAAERRKLVAVKKDTPKGGEAEDDEDEEAEEVPEEWADLSPAEQKKKILMRSFWLMGLGTFLVLIFSDPMVDVLSAIGKTTGVPAFYVSFILAPMASNASELVAAYSYALKKTSKTITISMSTLEGAACMNNTFCLGIFFTLIYVQGLAWRFTAETIVIVFVQVVVGLIAMTKTTQTVLTGLIIISLYPVSLALVTFLECSLVNLD